MITTTTSSDPTWQVLTNLIVLWVKSSAHVQSKATEDTDKTFLLTSNPTEGLVFCAVARGGFKMHYQTLCAQNKYATHSTLWYLRMNAHEPGTVGRILESRTVPMLVLFNT